MVRVSRTVMATGTPVISQPEADATPVKAERLDVHVLTPLNAIMSDAYTVLGLELRHYAKRARAGAVLNDEEARIVSGHVRSLALLTGEEREARKLDDALSKLDDKQLVKLAASAMKALKDGGE